MTHWITNVPESRIKHSHAYQLDRAKDLKGMLEFVQKTQPDVSMDHLMQEILEWYMKRKKFNFPLYGDTERVQYTLPESLNEQVCEVVHARQVDDPNATVAHVTEHAIECYLNSHGALSKAWKEEKKKQRNRHKDTPVDQASVPQKTKPDEGASSAPIKPTTSVSSPYAKPMVSTGLSADPVHNETLLEGPSLSTTKDPT